MGPQSTACGCRTCRQQVPLARLAAPASLPLLCVYADAQAGHRAGLRCPSVVPTSHAGSPPLATGSWPVIALRAGWACRFAMICGFRSCTSGWRGTWGRRWGAAFWGLCQVQQVTLRWIVDLDALLRSNCVLLMTAAEVRPPLLELQVLLVPSAFTVATGEQVCCWSGGGVCWEDTAACAAAIRLGLLCPCPQARRTGRCCCGRGPSKRSATSSQRRRWAAAA